MVKRLPKMLSFFTGADCCCTATTCKPGVCESGGYVRLQQQPSSSSSSSSSRHYLASPAGSTSGCGSPSCPWVLRPPRGQRFNLTFYNFDQLDSHHQHHQQQQQASRSSLRRFASAVICPGDYPYSGDDVLYISVGAAS